MYNKLINNIIIFLTILASISFLDLAILNSKIIKGVQILDIGLLIFFNAIYIIYDQKEKPGKLFTPNIYFILLSSVLSVFAAYMWHQQSFFITIYEQRFLFLFIFYFTLHNFKIKPEVLERIIYTMGITIACVYLIQYITYPMKLLDVPIRIDRGTVRIELQGIIYHEIALLYCFNKMLNQFKIKHLIMFLFLLSVFILYGSRGTIITNLVSVMFVLMLNKNTKSKYVIGFLTIIIASLVLYQFKDIFTQLIQASNKDVGSGVNYVRYKAAKYFLGDFYPNKLAYLIGNGSASNLSPYGIQMNSLVRQKGYYLNDLGVIMPFVKYGLFFIIAILFLLIKAVRIKLTQDLLYLKVIIINLIIYFPLGGGYDNPALIVCFIMVLFIIEKNGYLIPKQNYP